VTVSTEYST